MSPLSFPSSLILSVTDPPALNQTSGLWLFGGCGAEVQSLTFNPVNKETKKQTDAGCLLQSPTLTYWEDVYLTCYSSSSGLVGNNARPKETELSPL